MTARFLTWARCVPLRAEPHAPIVAQRVVLLLLADNADAAGTAWPSTGNLATTAGVSRATIVAALNALAAAGHIEAPCGRSIGGRGATTRWRLVAKPAALRTVSANGDQSETVPTGDRL
jgi:DNA-binding FadR family transcriptional regulator